MSDLIAWNAPWSGRLLVLLVSLAGCLVVAWSYRRRPARGDRCRRCGYDLRGSAAERCPECGHPRGAWSWRVLVPQRRIGFAIGLCVVVLMPVFVAQRRVREFGWGYYMRFQPLYWLDPYATEESAEIGGVRFRAERERRLGTLRVVLRDRDGIRVLTGSEGPISEPMWRCTGIQTLRCGDGKLCALVGDYSGGAHCCTTHWAFLIEDRKARFLRPLATGNSGIAIRDSDGDGIDEVLLADDAFAYWRTAYAASPREQVVLRFEAGDLRVDAARMRRPVPSEEERRAAIEECFALAKAEGRSNRVPERVWALALAWIYAGHGPEAMATVRAAWPPERTDRDEFLADFLATLGKSRWAEEIAALSGPAFIEEVQASAPD